MPRIRTFKPDFLRHEKLQDLEMEYPESKPMLVFLGLLTQCDKNGVFEWKPKHLALDILPFVWQGSIGEAMGKALGVLWENGMISQFMHQGKTYGYIPTFTSHQRISGKEKTDPARFAQPPENQEEFTVPTPQGSTGEALGKQQGKQEREKEREGKGKGDDAGEEPKLPEDETLPPSEEETQQQQQLRKIFDEKKEKIIELSGVPEEEYRMLKERAVAYYKHKSYGADPYFAALSWANREWKDGKGQATDKEMADILAFGKSVMEA